MEVVRLRLAAVLLACALVGCGFTRASSPDGGGTPASADLAGTDGGDNGATGDDLAGIGGTDGGGGGGGTSGTSGTGPGPLGALPAGFCCNSNDDCRSRNCAGLLLPVHYCSDECDHDSICTVWGGNMKCDVNSATCVAATTPTTCLDPSLYHYGSKAIGTCCQAGFDKSGQECLGGLCESVGPTSNPFYCTQGCDMNTPCPAPYVCNSASFCSLPDPNATYTCQ